MSSELGADRSRRVTLTPPCSLPGSVRPLMQSSHAPQPRSASGSRLGTAILLTLITMIVLVGLDVALWHYDAETLGSHPDAVLWGTYVGFGVLVGLVLLLVRSASPAATVFAVIVVALGSLA